MYYTTRSGHHCCLPWYLATESGDTTKGLNSPYSHCITPIATYKDHGVINIIDPTSLSHWTIMGLLNPDPELPHTPHLVPYITRSRSQHSLHWQIRVFPYWSQEMCRHLLKATRIMKNQGNMTPLREHSKLSEQLQRNGNILITWQRVKNNYSKDAERARI